MTSSLDSEISTPQLGSYTQSTPISNLHKSKKEMFRNISDHLKLSIDYDTKA